MKIILCLLAVLCAVNAKSLRDTETNNSQGGYIQTLLNLGQAAHQALKDKLAEAGIDLVRLEAALAAFINSEVAQGKTPGEIEQDAVNILQDGCKNGFIVEDMELQNILNAFRPAVCPLLGSIQQGAMADIDGLRSAVGDAISASEADEN